MKKLKKAINAFGVFSIASGAMISSGIFILPGVAYAQTGPWLFLSYLIAGLLGLFGIMSMIELSTAMPKAGGDYFFINKSLGPMIGSLSGFLGWFALSLKSSFAVFGLTEIIYQILGIPPLISGLILCLLFIALNIVGAKEAAVLQIIMVIALLTLMAVFVIAGMRQLNSAYFNFSGKIEINNIFITSGFIFISFGGLLKVANMSEEVINPRKNLPLGMIFSVITVTIVYVLMVVVMTGTLEPQTFSNSLTPVADSARITIGSIGYIIILIASALAFITTANAGIMAASRYPLALSKDRLVPSVLGKVSQRTGSPVISIIITGILIYLSLLLPLEILVKAASTVILSSYVLTNLSVIIFRESKLINYSPSYKAPFYPWLQIVSILLFSFFIVELGLSAIEISLGMFAIGFLVYLLYGRRKAGKESAIIHLLKKIVDKRLLNGTMEDDFREIIIDRDNIEQDNFDKLLKTARIIDLNGHFDYSTMLRIVVPDIAPDLNMPAREIINRFEKRQDSANTALSPFIAIPHIVIDGTEQMFMHIIRASEGINFTKNEPEVKAVFLLGGTKDIKVLHLKTIAAIASLVSQHGFEKKWTEADSEVKLKNLLLVNKRRRYH